MSRKPARVTQADIARVIRAIRQEKADMAVEIRPDGTIRIAPEHEELCGLPEADIGARQCAERKTVIPL